MSNMYYTHTAYDYFAILAAPVYNEKNKLCVDGF